MRQAGGAEDEREAERDEIERTPRVRGGLAEDRPGWRKSFATTTPSAPFTGTWRDGVEEFREAEIEMLQHEDAEEDGAAHQQDGLDDLHPGRREHAAEDDVDDHQHADAR